MSNQEIRLTVVGIYKYKGRFPFSAGRQLICSKEPDNRFDKKAIKVLDVGNTKVGYIANSSSTVLEGTLSASQVYDFIGDYSVIEVVSSTEYNVICKVVEQDFKVEKLIEAFTIDRFDPAYPFTDEYPPEEPYPFDFCEFPFEYNLVDIDYFDDTIPDKWRMYLMCSKLGIDEKKYDEICNIMLDAEKDQGLYITDVIYFLNDLISINERDTAAIKKIILDNLEDFGNGEYENLALFNNEETTKIAEKISKILQN